MKTVPVKCFELIEQPPEEEEEVAKNGIQWKQHRQTNSNNEKKIKPNAHTDNKKNLLDFTFLAIWLNVGTKKRR